MLQQTDRYTYVCSLYVSVLTFNNALCFVLASAVNLSLISSTAITISSSIITYICYTTAYYINDLQFLRVSLRYSNAYCLLIMH
jgi:hypothetical protein